MMKCYSYKFNINVNNQTACSGSFDECKELVDCASDKTAICFAVARYEDDSNSSTRSITTEKPKLKIVNAGCFVHNSEDTSTCGTDKCPGDNKGPGKNYYCCCTGTACNGQLIPRELPPVAHNSTTTSSTTSPVLPTPQESIPVVNQSVMLLVVALILISTVIFGAYYRIFRVKRHASGNNRAGDRNQSGSRSTSANKNNNHTGTDVSILMPFRNSFNDDASNNYQYSPRQPGQKPGEPPNSRMNHNNTMNPVNGMLPNHREQNQNFDLKDIKLLEMVGSGRFGTVHRANLVKRRHNNNSNLASNDSATSQIDGLQQCQDNEDEEEGEQLINSEIAVKIIPNNEYQSWQNELKIYNSSRTRHPNILSFLGSCESTQTSANWLLVEYASNGSLHHYLKENPISWDEFLTISLGIVRGLSHLHDADIAHRDFKSKNVLLRHDLSPCITDFGVASMLDITGGSHNEQRKKYLQVGTPRYMAPEVLECSVAFTKISFTKIDVYALSLVLWELLSRCYPLPKLIITDTLLSLSMTSRNSNAQPGVETFMLPPPIESSQPTTSTPNKQTADMVAAEPSENGFFTHGHNNYHNAHGRDGLGLVMTDGGMNSSDATRYHLQRFLDERIDAVPSYRVPFEDVVGPNPDINAMRQIVVNDKIRPPIRPEWRFYPIAKLCQAIIDGWEYDHDARISASCFVERIETIIQQQQNELEDISPPETGGNHQPASVSRPTALETTTTATTTMTAPTIATTVT